jgi:hypothetical protein
MILKTTNVLFEYPSDRELSGDKLEAEVTLEIGIDFQNNSFILEIKLVSLTVSGVSEFFRDADTEEKEVESVSFGVAEADAKDWQIELQGNLSLCQLRNSFCEEFVLREVDTGFQKIILGAA